MLKLTHYIAKTILSSTLIICISLISIFFIVTFLTQTNDIGSGKYGAFDALIYVLLQVPSNIYLIMPMSALLGCLMGLGILAGHSELIVMRSIGCSTFQIGKGVLLASVIISIFSLIIGGYIAPKASRIADLNKALLKDGNQSVLSDGSEQLWLKEGNNFIQFDKSPKTGEVNNISIFTIKNGNLFSISSAKNSAYKNSQWKLYNVKNIIIKKSNIQSTLHKEQIWNSLLPPQLVKVIGSDPKYLTLFSLIQYSIYTENSENINLQIWNIILQPIMIAILMMMAVPFSFGSMRSSTLAIKLVIGLGLGFIFYIVDQFFGPVTIVYNLPAFLGAFIPCLIFFFILILLFIKMRE